MPLKILHSCSKLRRLSIMNGYRRPVDMRLLRGLDHLEYLALDSQPLNLHELLKLRSLHQIICIQCYTKLTRKLMMPFSRMQITELGMLGPALKSIENGTFSEFKYLSALNFADAAFLLVDDIIDAISTSQNLKVNKLILDFVNANRHYWNLGPRDTPKCRSAWKGIQHLSMRGVHLSVITPGFAKCLSNLVTLSIGFNNMLLADHHIALVTAGLHNIRSIDVSYGFVYEDTRLPIFAWNAWTRQTDDYFPPVIDATKCSVKNVSYPIVTTEECKNFIRHALPSLPQCLSYVNINHFGLAPSHSHTCTVLPNNNLQVMNLSFIAFDNVIIRKPIFGLEVLRVLDVTGSSIASIPIDIAQYVPDLTTLKVANNELTKLHLIGIPSSLTEMDFSGNSITYVNLSFVSDSSLKSLLLNDNKLDSIDFLIPDLSQLHDLDLRNNKLIHMPENVTTQMNRLFEQKVDFKLSLSGNLFICDCLAINFIQWVKGTKINLENRDDIKCEFNGDIVNVINIDVMKLNVKCKTVIIWVAALAGIFLAVAVTAGLVYKFRWSIRWRYYYWKYKTKHRLPSDAEESLLSMNFKSAYIIYPEDDNEVRRWVVHSLVHKIENEFNLPPVFLPGRDDIAGVPYIENITAGLASSRTAIWVINSAFCRDSNCNIAATFAFHRFQKFRQSRNLIVLLDSQLHLYEDITTVERFLDKRLGIPKITYSSDQAGQRVFWVRLQRFIGNTVPMELASIL